MYNSFFLIKFFEDAVHEICCSLKTFTWSIMEIREEPHTLKCGHRNEFFSDIQHNKYPIQMNLCFGIAFIAVVMSGDL